MVITVGDRILELPDCVRMAVSVIEAVGFFVIAVIGIAVAVPLIILGKLLD